MDLWCRSTAVDTKHGPFFVSHKGYRIHWLAPKTGYQPTLKIVFIVVLVEDFFTIGRDLRIYRRLDIAISMNQRVLIKHDENLYSDSTLIHEKWTFRFRILELLVLLPRAFSNCHNFLVRASNYVFHISILIVSTRASSLVLQFFSLSPSYGPFIHFFVSWVKSNEIFQETRVHNMQNIRISPSCEIHNADLDIEILTILQL
jgi:hypothetical protein